MTVRAWPEEANLAVEVLDEGHGLIPRTDSPGLGLGLGVMAQLADDFRIANRLRIANSPASCAAGRLAEPLVTEHSRTAPHAANAG